MTWQGLDVPRVTELVSAHVPVDGTDIVIFHEGTRRLYRLAGTAIPVWRTIDGARTVGDIISAVAEEYCVEVVDIEDDIVTMLDRLRDEEVLVRSV